MTKKIIEKKMVEETAKTTSLEKTKVVANPVQTEKVEKEPVKALEFVDFAVGHSVYRTTLSKKFQLRTQYKPLDLGRIHAFIPGTVLDVLVTEGDEVEPETVLLILDAMKMKNKILATKYGIVRKILVEKGAHVKNKELLVIIELDD